METSKTRKISKTSKTRKTSKTSKTRKITKTRKLTIIIPSLLKESFHSSKLPLLLLNMMMNLPTPDLVITALLLGVNSGKQRKYNA
jgi:hypothetical protein